MQTPFIWKDIAQQLCNPRNYCDPKLYESPISTWGFMLAGPASSLRYHGQFHAHSPLVLSLVSPTLKRPVLPTNLTSMCLMYQSCWVSAFRSNLLWHRLEYSIGFAKLYLFHEAFQMNLCRVHLSFPHAESIWKLLTLKQDLITPTKCRQHHF